MITRPPPPSGRPPAYAVAGRAFGQTSLRPVVIGSCIAAIVWSLVWYAQAFEDISGDKPIDNLQQLGTFDIVFGSLYAAVTAIEFLGLLAAITRRTPLARLFVGLSLAAVVLAVSAELVRTVVHFRLKGTVIQQCLINSTTDSQRQTGIAFWGGSTGNLLRPSDALDFCDANYNRTSVSTIAWLILTALFALFSASAAFSFYRQLLDPNTYRSSQAPSDQFRLDAMRHQAQPYGGGYVPYPGFNNAPNYAPPPGPPPGVGGYSAPPYETGRLPDYGREFAAQDVGDEKAADQKGGDPFMDAQHAGLGGVGPSETDLTHRV